MYRAACAAASSSALTRIWAFCWRCVLNIIRVLAIWFFVR